MNAKLVVAGGHPRLWFSGISLLTSHSLLLVAGAPPPSVVLENFCMPTARKLMQIK